MSREKSEKDMRNVPITVRLNEEEHEKLKQCAAEICKEIEDFILELQQKATLPQRFSLEELTEQGAV
ncbi:hypothetical protein E5329_06780 [Petralouisia muris]|uniref:Uncharacterized protein n=1 Tax=Petralouisia muris TaxID=3032872 RepID=A0AC61RZK6_9FIRM|nr:hypothetical protein [Petralouisia muris]TGY97143.1 hypothetical protein E5329_06780 [Petralouisia muris]